jgi:chorismate-pyruvate lyase
MTLYRAGPRVVSRHLAYVDVSVLSSKHDRLLREGTIDLGGLLRTNASIHRTGFEFGDQDDLHGLGAELASCLPSGFGSAFGWRTYTASIGATAVFVVAEVVFHRCPSTA